MIQIVGGKAGAGIDVGGAQLGGPCCVRAGLAWFGATDGAGFAAVDVIRASLDAWG